MFRVITLLFIILKFGTRYFAYRFHITEKPNSQFVKRFFEDAGGAFIKFGQILALRIDVLPKEYSLELIDLFDHTKPFSYQAVERMFIQELGEKPQTIFKVFEKQPFASASFAQVHAAKLANNKTVIVKIQKPHIEEDIQLDFFIITILCFIADLFFKIEALPWKEFAKEFKTWTINELDYHLEAENSQKIYDILQKEKVTDIVVPKVYPRLSTKRILVQDYIDGVPLSRVLREMRDGNLNAKKLKAMNIDIHKTPRVLVGEMMREFFFDGFFHADPHPGNILLLNNGKIGLIDFGIVGKTVPRKLDFMKFIIAGATDDFKNAGYYFLKFAGYYLEQVIGSLFPVSAEEEQVSKFMKLMSTHFYTYCKKIEHEMRNDLNTMKIDYTTMFIHMLKYVQRYHIKVPKECIIFLRALSIIGFLAKEMDISFRAADEINYFFKTHSKMEIARSEMTSMPYKRISKEEALEKVTNWLANLFETDQALYQVVNKAVSGI